MTKRFIFIFAASCSLWARAVAGPVPTDSIGNSGYQYSIEEVQSATTPSYLDGVLVASPWTANWFIGVSGGASAFLGNPLGCEDAAFMGCQCRKMVHPSHREPYRLAGWQVQGRFIGHAEFPPLPCGLALERFGRAAERRHSGGVESCPLCGCGPITPQGQRTKTVLLILRHTGPLSDYRTAGCHHGAWRMHHIPGI